MSVRGGSRDEERIDGGNRSVWEGAVKGEAEEFGILAVLRLRSGCSTSERAAGRFKKLGIGGEVNGIGSVWHFLDGSSRAQECSGVQEVEEVEEIVISCVFW